MMRRRRKNDCWIIHSVSIVVEICVYEVKIWKKDTVCADDLTNMEFSIRLDIARARDDMDEIKKLIEQILYILDTK